MYHTTKPGDAMLTPPRAPSQWTVESDGKNGYYLKNNDGGLYLTFEGRIHAGQHIVGTSSKKPFKITLDPNNANYRTSVKCLLYSFQKIS